MNAIFQQRKYDQTLLSFYERISARVRCKRLAFNGTRSRISLATAVNENILLYFQNSKFDLLGSQLKELESGNQQLVLI